MSDRRATESELLDDPSCDSAVAEASYRFMSFINAFAGGTAVVRRFVAEEAGKHADGKVIRILDIGSGSCDIPPAVGRWAGARGIRLQFTCLEPGGRAFDLAVKRLSGAGDPDVRVLREDVFGHLPAEPYDCATASMCFHHFSDEKILEVVERLRQFVSGSILINDLRRSPVALFGAYLLTTGSNPGVRHDGMLSVRRGFKVGELRELLQRIPGSDVSVRAAWCFRVAAVIA